MGATDRPLRADARRNRDRLLEVAVQAFSEDPEVPLEKIAREAGVGVGTLYRHYPTREVLVEAAYRNELARLCDSVDDLIAAMAPDLALREWMGLFLDYMATKRGLADALRALIATGANPYAQSRTRLLDAIGSLLDAAKTAGLVRDDIAPDDVLVSLSGVALVTGEPDRRAQAQRLLDLLMDGLRHGSAND
jgi:AcrR family transcriptional regulator